MDPYIIGIPHKMSAKFFNGILTQIFLYSIMNLILIQETPSCALCEFAMNVLEKQIVTNRTMDMVEVQYISINV